jgi:hypothetical protein
MKIGFVSSVYIMYLRIHLKLIFISNYKKYKGKYILQI